MNKILTVIGIILLVVVSFGLGWYVRPNTDEIVSKAILKWEESERSLFQQQINKLTVEAVKQFVDNNGGMIVPKQQAQTPTPTPEPLKVQP